MNKHMSKLPPVVYMDPARVRELQAEAIARKDALLREAREAMQNLRNGAVCVWALGGSHETEQAIAAIDAELAKGTT